MAAFVPLAPLLSQEELDGLTAEQLANLREEIQKAMRTDADIQTILRARARQVYNDLTGGGGGQKP